MEVMMAGEFEGDVCGRNGCKGIIDLSKVENCSCHINPPCGACTSTYCLCPECDWVEDRETYTTKDIDFDMKWSGNQITAWRPRKLDPTKLDWRSESHTHFSMKKIGVFPKGTTREQVEKEVRGTFGGRFESFDPSGSFVYIAYTD